MAEDTFVYERDTWKVIDRCFDDQPNYLAHNQLDPYNELIQSTVPVLIKKDCPIVIEQGWDPETQTHQIRYEVNFTNVYMSHPQISEGSGTVRPLYPAEARHRNLTYSANLYLDVEHSLYKEGKLVDKRTEEKIPFKIPAMVKSKLCYLEKTEAQSLIEMGECPYDKGGYFIINGSEKVVISQERPVDNEVVSFPQKPGSKYDEVVEIRSTIDQRFYPVKNNIIALTRSKDTEIEQYLRIGCPYLTKEVPLVVMFKAIGITSEKEICEMIVMNNVEELEDDVAQLVTPSLEELLDMDGSKRKIITQYDALIYISRHVNINMDYLIKKLGKTPTEQEKLLARNQYILDILRRDLLPHVGPDFRKKAMYLGYMAQRLIQVKLGIRLHDIRDHYANKRLDTPGPKLKQLFHGSFGRLIKEIKNRIGKALADNETEKVNNSLRKIIQNCTIEAPIKKALSTGDWSTNKNANFNTSTNLGIAQVLSRMSYIGYLSHIRRVQTPMEKAGGKIIEPRKLHPSQNGYICPNETPEGQQVGIVKNLALMCTVTIATSVEAVKMVLNKLGVTPADMVDITKISLMTKVFLNGEWMGLSSDPRKIYLRLKELKRSRLNPYMGIYWDYEQFEIHIRTDGGRYTRPLYVVERYGDRWLPKIAVEWKEKQIWKMSWQDLIGNGYVEYVDPKECENCLIAMTYSVLEANKAGSERFFAYTHLEIHCSMWHGVVSQMVPMPDHNQSPRNCFVSSMGKQALGLYATNFNSRFDTMANVLCYPQKPLVNTRTAKYVNLDKLPHGQQCVVAVACYTGYNQEDSILMNKASIERGKFNSIYYKTYVDEMNPHKSSTSESEQFGIPNPNTTQGRKHGSYDKLDETGFVKVGAFVEQNDVIIGKTVKLREPVKTDSGVYITHSDISTTIKQGDFGYVDKRIPSPGSVKNLNSDNNQFCKVRIAQFRQPVIGDKLASRAAQKATVGLIIEESNMPRTDTGIVPDIVMNPHALPSRMTVAQTLECILGKNAALDAQFKDATPFTHFDQKEVGDALEKYGFQRDGEEVLYNGMTGEQLRVTLFVGPTYYQRLKHMVADKVHARATGRVNNLTKQSVEGRGVGGGLRLGEMERDVLIAHGTAQFQKERFMDSADKFRVFVGKKNHSMVVGNPDIDLYLYDGKHLNPEEVSEVQLPHAMKLLMHELTSMGTDIRMITED